MNAVAPESSAVSCDEESVARSVLAIVRGLATELHPGMAGAGKLGPDASIERDFGLDSLARAELALRVEQALATAIPDAVLAESETVRDLARALVRTRGTAPAAMALQPRIGVEYAAVPAPVSPATLLDALEWRAREQPERTHILLADREAESARISFGSLRREATSIAAGLKRRGIRPDETVAIMLPTGRGFFAAFYGALYAQAVPVPLYPPAHPSQIEAHLRRVPQSSPTAKPASCSRSNPPGDSRTCCARWAPGSRSQGRIEFQGPSATSGYFHNPRETARLFDGKWLDTADLGYLAEGELYVTGRAKDIIIRGGHNIHPQELEEAVARLPGVRKGGVAVFPAIDRHSGTERIIVLAETREENSTARNALISSINHLAVDLLGLPVDEVVLAPPRTVLKTSSGKIRRSACRDAYERGELGATRRPLWLQLTRLVCRAFVTRSALASRRLMGVAWGVRTWAVGACLAPLLWLSVLLTPRLARRRRVAAAFARLALRLCDISLRIQEPTQAARGSRVFVANHASYLDGLLLLTALPPDVAFVAKRELAGSFAIGRLLERLGCVFIERHDLHEAATGAHELQARLRAGESLVVFAEGTFRRDPGLLPFHIGAFSAAAAADAVVVPVAIRGTRTMLPDGAVLPRPAGIDIIMGEPLSPEDAS